ncbi:DUF3616 domain-containing protein [Consotaella aegiceratis]|uniref:DUF3616 domain-containing protein n=1 Tax=Consotaella aegiceratis TaxID=3097961 RepID=UPI002F401293
MAKTQRKRRTPAAGVEADLSLDRKPWGTADLYFEHHHRLAHVQDPIWRDVSSLAVVGRSVFLSCDETATVERVVLDPETGEAREHANFALGDAFDLPDGPEGEMDIEGLAVADGYLWICGSHSLKRDDPDDGLDDMADIDWDANRGFLGRVPLLDRGDGVFELVAAIDRLDGEPAREAAMLPMTDSKKTPLRKMLAKDPLIGPFVEIPCKENGLDIEGLAAQGQTVLLGLRGPVLRGYAFIVRLEMKANKDGELKPKKFDGGKRYALQAIDLNGQAIRDMVWRGDRLLILSGATTDLEALQSVFAIDDYDPSRPIYREGALKRVLDLPAIRGSDHAEGIELIEVKDATRLLVAYDSPADSRTDPAQRRLTADLFDIAVPAAKD